MNYEIVPFTDLRKSFIEPKPAWGIEKGDGAVFVRCGVCGKCIDLPHSIADDGTVSPSVVCACGWHVHIKLQNWLVAAQPRERGEKQ